MPRAFTIACSNATMHDGMSGTMLRHATYHHSAIRCTARRPGEEWRQCPACLGALLLLVCVALRMMCVRVCLRSMAGAPCSLVCDGPGCCTLYVVCWTNLSAAAIDRQPAQCAHRRTAQVGVAARGLRHQLHTHAPCSRQRPTDTLTTQQTAPLRAPGPSNSHATVSTCATPPARRIAVLCSTSTASDASTAVSPTCQRPREPLLCLLAAGQRLCGWAEGRGGARR